MRDTVIVVDVVVVSGLALRGLHTAATRIGVKSIFPWLQ